MDTIYGFDNWHEAEGAGGGAGESTLVIAYPVRVSSLSEMEID